MKPHHPVSRRHFLGTSAAFVAVLGSPPSLRAEDPPELIIDIHQHTNYSGRTHEQFIKHQRALGISKTVLLPAGSPVERPSTHEGKSNGLAAQCGGNESVRQLALEHPKELAFGSNEVTDLASAREEVEKYLKLGAIIIGEQKFSLDCDSPHIESLADLAQEYQVPILMHFQHNTYNLGIERFHKVLAKFPKVNFIGHAQTWWGNIDAKHDQGAMYPTTKVARGGITDRLLTDHPNMFGDLSAGSGLNSMLRDEEHARGFLDRHQDQLLFGSDCNDTIGRGPACLGARILEAVRRLAPNEKAVWKILYENASRLLKIKAG